MYLESNLDNPKTLNPSNEVPVARSKAAGGDILGEFPSSEMTLIDRTKSMVGSKWVHELTKVYLPLAARLRMPVSVDELRLAVETLRS